MKSPNLEKDKQLHMLAGAVIATVAWFLLSLAQVQFAAALATLAGLAAGIAREVYNKARGGLFDVADIGATLVGATIIISIYKLGYALVLSYGVVWSHDEKLFVLASASVLLIAIFHQVLKDD